MQKTGAKTFGLAVLTPMYQVDDPTTLSFEIFSITKRSIRTLSITIFKMTLSIMTLSIMTLNIMTLIIMTLIIMTLISIADNLLSFMLNIVYAEHCLC
jgi:hypothetical protein